MKSIRDIYKIGKGPSSSHTMGPERAAIIFKAAHPQADSFRVHLYGSLTKTGVGHGTDRVIREVLSPIPTEIIFDPEVVENSHPNTMDFIAVQDGVAVARQRFESVGGGDIRYAGGGAEAAPEVYPENTFAEIMGVCKNRGFTRFSDYVVANEGPEVWDFLRTVWQTMSSAIAQGLQAEGILPGGLNVQRRAKVLSQPIANEKPGMTECRTISAYAFAVAEQNADNGTIVTAPTCGACGVLPAVLRYVKETRHLSEDDILRGLAVAGLFGNLVKRNASISGAECGCQAEIGTACSMAAAALAEMFGLNLDQVEYAAEIAMEHHLGLTCDPVCGLVQIPCIERNAVAALRAINACNLSYFLYSSRNISFDTVVRTMYETGQDLSHHYRETSEGGLAKHYENHKE